MSIISQLAGKGKKVNINGVEIEIEPLKAKDMDLFLDMDRPGKEKEAIKEIIIRSIKTPDEEITPEEIDSISIGNLKLLMEEILELNGMKEKGAPKEIIDRIKNVRGRSS